jgi:hypothetical protein
LLPSAFRAALRIRPEVSTRLLPVTSSLSRSSRPHDGVQVQFDAVRYEFIGRSSPACGGLHE